MSEEPIKVTPRESRQAVKIRPMQYVLGVGISLTVIALIVGGVWILGGFDRLIGR